MCIVAFVNEQATNPKGNNVNTTYTIDEASTETRRYNSFGQAARGGKIHRTDYNGKAWCLNGSGHISLFRTLVKVGLIEWPEDETTENREARWAAQRETELAALAEAKIPTSALCKKCCGFLLK